MLEQKEKNNFTFMPNIAVVLCITIVSWLILVPLVNSISLPLGKNETGIISLTSVKNISPYTDYIKYFILLLTPSLIVAIALKLSQPIIDKFFTVFLWFYNNSKLFFTAALILLTSWIFIGSERAVYFYDNIFGKPINDTFHEGEYLGFLPNFILLKQPFIQTFLVHGFGIDVLPSLIANKLAVPGYGIGFTRLFVHLETIFAAIGCVWLLWEICSSVSLKASRLKVFAVVSIIFCVLESILFFNYGYRDALFLLQLAMIIRFFRGINLNARINKEKIIIAFLIGASIPLSFFYVYDRALYFTLVYISTSAFSICFGRKLFIKWIGSSFLGLIISTFLLILKLNLVQISEVISQILYWSKYGKYISFIPLSSLEMAFDSQFFWLAMLVQSYAIAHLLLESRYHCRISKFLRRNFISLILLVAALSYMRIALDRSDIEHAGSSALATAFLFAEFSLRGYNKYFENRLKPMQLNLTNKVLVTLLLITLIASEPAFNLLHLSNKLQELYKSLSIPDEQLLQPNYLNAYKTLKAEIEKQSCFFTFTSEGLWYYLFNKPSCSKFSYVFYAKPTIAQNIVVRELEQTKPELIMLSSDPWFAAIDGVPIPEYASIIYQYVLDNYKPYRAFETQWFWKRDEKEFSLIKSTSGKPSGFVDTKVSKEVRRSDDVTLAGWAVLPEQNKVADAVYLSSGKNNKLVGVTNVNLSRPDVAQSFSEVAFERAGWEIHIPTRILAVGSNLIRVWAYDARNSQLRQIGNDINIEMIY
jgi:hypothetical protein